jgi:hypothetical protein
LLLCCCRHSPIGLGADQQDFSFVAANEIKMINLDLD